jgi:ribulose-phosphate 3-epimerase
MSEQMNKVSIARSRINTCKEPIPLLQIDGGVSESTIEIAANAGANCFVAGSAVYKDLDPAQMVVNLRKVAEESLRF